MTLKFDDFDLNNIFDEEEQQQIFKHQAQVVNEEGFLDLPQINSDQQQNGQNRQEEDLSSHSPQHQGKFSNEQAEDSLPRFCQIQRSVEVLKSVVPSIFDNEFIDEIYTNLYGRMKETSSIQKERQYPKQYPKLNLKNTALDQQRTWGRGTAMLEIDKQDYRKELHLWNHKQQFKHLSSPLSQDTRKQTSYKDANKNVIDANEMLNSSGNNHNKLIYKMNKVWNHRYQSVFLQSYRELKSITQIRDHFHQVFPQDAEAFSTISLRSKLFKIVRQGIRKFYSTITQNKNPRLPQIKRINELASRAIIYNNNGIGVRLLLVDIYEMQGYNQKLLAETIMAITKYVMQLEHAYKLNSLQDPSVAKKKNGKEIQFYRREEGL